MMKWFINEVKWIIHTIHEIEHNEFCLDLT